MLTSVKSAVSRLAAPAAGSVRAAASRASFSPANAAKSKLHAGSLQQGTHLAALKPRVSTLTPEAQALVRAFSTSPVAHSSLSASIPVARGQKPTLELAMAMPRDFCDMTNEALCIYAAQGNHEAHRERLLREIMNVDNVSWKDAHKKLEEMEAANKKTMFIATMPYKTGIAVAVIAGVGSLPMVFDLTTALWFNEYFVTADVAEPEDLETWLEVGSWTWSWMEPPLGHMSFFLLCCQFARNQMLNLRSKPYTGRVQIWRAKRLANKYPMYSELIVSDFAVSCEWHS
jgi:hypothetical protein